MKSLKNIKLSSLIKILIVIAIIIVILVDYEIDYQKRYEDGIRNNILYNTSEKTHDLNTLVGTTYENLNALAIGIDDRLMNNTDEIVEHMSFVKNTMNMDYVLYANKNGTGTTYDNVNINISDKKYFKDTAKYGSCVVCDYITIKDEPSNYLIVTAPIYKNSRFNGIIVGAYSENKIAKGLIPKFFEDAGSAAIINRNGKILLKDDDNVFDNANTTFKITNDKTLINGYTSNQIKQILKDNKSVIVKYKGDGKKHYAVYESLGVSDWYVFYCIPSKAVVRNMGGNFKSEVILFLELLICAAVLIIITVNNQKRINRLRMEQIRIYSTDELTGTLNEKGFLMAAREILDDSKDNFYVVSIDISKFGCYNAIFGRERGNELLQSISQVLSDSLEEDEICARFYGDEFVCLVKKDANRDIYKIINSQIKQIEELEKNNVIIVNYGVYEVINKNQRIRRMIDCSRTAKKEVKGNYNKRIAFYNEDFRYKSIEYSKLEMSMEKAIENNEFKVFYQPKYDAVTEKAIAAEALSRWEFIEGFLSPNEYIELFEKNGFILKLDFYVLESVCKFLRKSIDSNIVVVPIAVNFSGRNLYDSNFCNKVISVIRKYKLEYSLIEIEFTETTMAQTADMLLPVIEKFHEHGIIVTMDDFGSGYSSLNLLKDIPVDCVKLDKEFLSVNEDSEKGKQIIEGVLEFTKRLNVKTVAEGVETKQQLEFLRKCNCDIIQGYYFSKPVSEESFVNIINKK